MNISYYLNNPRKILIRLGRGNILRLLTDEQYIRLMWKANMDYPLNLKNPRTYNEKLQWIKIYDHNPLYTTIVDKSKVKKYVSDIIGSEYVIPTLGVWDRFEDIDFSALPSQFVLKCTHDSGGIVICKDKSSFNLATAKKKLDYSMRRKYYWLNREWPYKNVKPRIIAEEYMEDKTTKELRDYKFFSFNGEVKALFIASDRQTEGVETKFDFFDMDYNHLDIINGHPNSTIYPQKPLCFEEMKELARKLSKGFPEIRVDFYEVNGKVFFGELTLFHWSGLVPFQPHKWDEVFGEWVQIPKVKNDSSIEVK